MTIRGTTARLPESDQPSPGKAETPAAAPQESLSWWAFVRDTDTSDRNLIQERLAREVQSLITQFGAPLEKYCLLSLYHPGGSISSWSSDQIFAAIKTENPDREKDIFLLLVSRGGQVEPAYQISKICKTHSKKTFVAVVPREAKSAATLITLGADQIHMGVLGELGPIDPQVGGLPALGVKRALETIAGICSEDPGSSEVFARYLARTVTIEHIGYCERVAESAMQYAERLLDKKSHPQAKNIAKTLVHEYKDHSFVIDSEEAMKLLGDSWILTDSVEIKFGETIYQLFEEVNLALGVFHKKQLVVTGSLNSSFLLFDLKKSGS